MIQLSNPVRAAVRQAFIEQFNGQLADACAALDITEQAFDIDFEGNEPGNYWDGPVTLSTLLDFLRDNAQAIPALCLYVDGQGSKGYTNAVFSGDVQLGGHVFLKYPRNTRDFETLAEAVQAAVTGIIHESIDDAWGGGTYNNDLHFQTRTTIDTRA